MADGTREPRMSRRTALGWAIAASAGAAAPAHAQAPTGPGSAGIEPLWIVVDPSGDGDRASLEAAVADAAAGSTIFAKAGTHEVGRTLRPRVAVRLTGEGGAVVRAAEGLDGPLISIEQPRVMVEQLHLQGGGGEAACVSIAARDANVRGCRVEPRGGVGVVVTRAGSHSVVRDCRVWGSGREGIAVRSATQCAVTGNVISDMSAAGIAVHGGGEHALAGNTLDDVEGYGIVIDQGARDVSASGNAASGCGSGIGLLSPTGDAVSGAALVGNAISEARSDGIELDGVDLCIVSGNTVRGSGGYGVIATNSTGCAVSGNTSGLNGAAGIALVGTSDSVCDGNVCHANGQRSTEVPRRGGIVLGGGSRPTSRNAVTGNRCFGGAGPGAQQHGLVLAADAAGNMVSGNLLDDNTGAGLEDTAGGRNDVAPWKKLRARVGRREVAVPHGLGYPPRAQVLTMTSAGRVWRSAEPDAQAVYLTADGPDRTVELLVG